MLRLIHKSIWFIQYLSSKSYQPNKRKLTTNIFIIIKNCLFYKIVIKLIISNFINRISTDKIHYLNPMHILFPKQISIWYLIHNIKSLFKRHLTKYCIYILLIIKHSPFLLIANQAKTYLFTAIFMAKIYSNTLLKSQLTVSNLLKRTKPSCWIQGKMQYCTLTLMTTRLQKHLFNLCFNPQNSHEYNAFRRLNLPALLRMDFTMTIV